ncbi:MAG: hypothetical protein U1C56_01460 [Candidatus Curtissbacteria bacterium]|nr:hypothetical protein [Candidatus Curtissbacteria bacterium]
MPKNQNPSGTRPNLVYNYIKIKRFLFSGVKVGTDPFTYPAGMTLKAYIPLVFKSAYQYCDRHPYAAIRQLSVSQGYFYKVLKQFS